VCGRLGVSRSFGDAKFKRLGVVCQPDISKFTLTTADKFIVLACDGLFSVMTVEDVVDFVNRCIDNERQYQREHPYVQVDLKAKQRSETGSQIVARKAAKKLIREAVLMRGCKDNVTAVVIVFDHVPVPA